MQVVLNEFLAELGISEFCGEVFEVGAVRGDGGEVGAGGDADSGFPAVWDDFAATLSGHVADFHSLGQASDPSDVRLSDVDLSAIHQVSEFVAGCLPFAGCDAEATFVVHAGVAVEVVHPERGFEKVNVEFLPVADGGERSVCAVPSVLDVDHEGEIGAHGVATGGEYFSDFVVALVHAGVVVGAEEGDLEFGRAEADGAGVQHPFDEGVAVLLEATAVGLEGGVWLDGVAWGVAEELPDGFAGGFASDVPKGHVDGADGVDDGAASAVHATANVHFLPKSLGVERVFADEHFLEAKAHGVGAGGLDAGAGNPRVDVALADAGDAFVGVHEDDDVVLCGGGGVCADVGNEEDMALDVGDLHCGAPPVALWGCGCNRALGLGRAWPSGPMEVARG